MFRKIPWIFILLSSILFVFSFAYVFISKIDVVENGAYSKEASSIGEGLTTVSQREILKEEGGRVLLAKKKITGSFISRTDNLGIVAMPFDTHKRSIEDQVFFRLKEKSQKGWYYTGVYNTNQIQDLAPFPFGFPKIKDSNNKVYIFEIESVGGTVENSLAIQKNNPFFAIHKFSKDELVNNPLGLFEFLRAKGNELMSLVSFRELVLIFLFSILSPIVIFIFLIFAKKITASIRFYLKKCLYFGVYALNKINSRITGVFPYERNKAKKRASRKDEGSIYKRLGGFMYSNAIFVLVILILITLLSRFAFSFADQSKQLVAPEIKFAHPYIGADFHVGIVDAIDNMLHGKSIYTGIQNYGSGFTLLTLPFVYLLNSNHVCTIETVASCHFTLYYWLLGITIGGYLLFILFISKKNLELLSCLLLFFLIFLLGVSGSFGLERGNIDIILSLMVGYLILWIFYLADKQKRMVSLVIHSILIGFVAAFLVNTKFFLLPIGLVALYSSRKVFVSFISFIVMYCILGYLPNILFHSPSDWYSSIYIAMKAGFVDTFAQSYRLQYNYSFNALASLATNCVEKLTCRGTIDWAIISIISFFLFIFTFISPFLNLRHMITKLNPIRFFYKSIMWIKEQRFNRGFLLLLLIISVALLILLPQQTYPYRMYYVLPLLMILWKESENNKRARIYCLLSIICIGIKGLWIFLDVIPSGYNILEARGMVIFVVLGFYFMIKAGIELTFVKKLKS